MYDEKSSAGTTPVAPVTYTRETDIPRNPQTRY